MSKCKSKNSSELWNTAELCTVVQTQLHQHGIEWVTSLCSPGSCWIFSAMRARCCHPPGTSVPSLQSCFPASRPQHITGTRGYANSGAKLGILPSLNFTRFPSSLFSNLVTHFWIAAQSSGVAATPLSFLSAANLLSAAQCPITEIRNKDVQQYRTQQQPFMYTVNAWPPAGCHVADNNPRAQQIWQFSAQVTVHLFHLYFKRLSRSRLWDTVKSLP